MINKIFLAGSVTLCCWTGWAAPLQRADVAAEPSLVAHFDCDRFRATAVGKAILAQVSDPDIASKLDALQAISSFDPRTQLHGLTCYTTSLNAKNGVLILYADFDSNRLVALAETMPDYNRVSSGTHYIHNWIDEKKKADGGEPHVSAAILGKRVIFGQSEAAVSNALAVMDGNAPSLAVDKSLPEMGAGGAGEFLQGVVNKFDFGSKDPNSAILKGSKMVRIRVGETGDQIQANVDFQASDADKATQIASIAQGIIALGKLQQDKPAALKLANAITIKQDEANVVATLTIAEADVVGLIKTGAENARAKSGQTNSPPPQ
jgi:hypothetical protein